MPTQSAAPRCQTLARGIQCTLATGFVLGLSVACGSQSPPEAAPVSPVEPLASSVAPLTTSPAASASSAEAKPTPPPPCPDGMLHVQHDYCPEMERKCLKSEYDRSNHITICHRFAEGENTCKAERVKLDFCIDRYEYPNEEGGHPPVMVSWYDAAGACGALGKRLCYESEWVAACEGPAEKPFPYGWERSSKKCNIDNRWISPSLKKIYSSDPAVSEPELKRLDQSKPSGAMKECVSDFGVYDLTGNFDEWALADRDRPKQRAVFAALKGGAWGHVRNACRPVTTSHEPEFTYYFVSFRCCSDPTAASEVASEGGGEAR
ncbi:MAG: SUMF1/EgtB/PvdO family nonheme iron enzyme [Polyangiaceae bacterium]|nr:SUMF1/EgtB/PvdO family nonheme iron enzyme [Polyangiaceae bacterium]